MQTHRLKFHPAFHPDKVRSLAVRWGRVAGDRMMLRFRLDGCEDVVVPKKAAGSGRGEDLWKTTCFELFLASSEGRYLEFNFSPSGQWAAYAFHGYRSGVRNHDPASEPEVTMDRGHAVLTVTVFLAAAEFDGCAYASLTAVVEEKRGRMSYWAARHAALKPDFHEPTCFVLPVP